MDAKTSIAIEVAHVAKKGCVSGVRKKGGIEQSRCATVSWTDSLHCKYSQYQGTKEWAGYTF